MLLLLSLCELNDKVPSPKILMSFPNDISQYELKDKIGQGSTSEVYSARCIPNGRDISIKKIDLEKYPLELDVLRMEVAFWSKSQHPNVVGYYGSFISGPVLYILMEYCAAGSIFDMLRFAYPNGFPDEAQIATVLKSVLQALQYIHENGQVHRDIKPGNILVCSDGSVMLGDFGVAASLVEQGRRRARFTVIGTPCYMAPEVFHEEIGYTEKADIWSFGITAIEIATGSAPYATLNPLDVIRRIMNAPPPSLPKDRFSSEFCDLVKTCLNHSTGRRPAASQLLQHPFFQKAKDGDFLVQTILSKLPPLARRYGQLNHIEDDDMKPSADGSNPIWSFDSFDDAKLPAPQRQPTPPQQVQQQAQSQPEVDSEPEQKEEKPVQKFGRFSITKQPSSDPQSLPKETAPKEESIDLKQKVIELTQKVDALQLENAQMKEQIRQLTIAIQKFKKD